MKAKELLSDFETLSTEEWMLKIEKFLKGRPFEELLLHLPGGAKVKPFYRKEDNNIVTLPRLNDNNWLIAESFCYDGINNEDINRAILKSLEGGAECINLILEKGSPADLSKILENVYLNMISINFSGPTLKGNTEAFLKAISELPGISESNGSIDIPKSNQKLKNFGKEIFRVKIDNDIIIGFSELLYDISKSFELSNSEGNNPEEFQKQINILFDLSDEYFLNIAAIRAFKRLWLALLEAYDVQNAQYPKIHCFTTESPTSADPYWNMISNTVQALSAAIAGVYSIEVRPTDLSAEKAEFSRRIARNVQQLLKLETYINHISDASAGAYYIENYSFEIIKHSWKSFISKL